jgi:hypothetical protein
MKKFDDLSLREMHIVLDRNAALKEWVRECANETSAWYIDDILRCFPRFAIEEAIDKECAVKVLDPNAFLHGLLTAHRVFHFLCDSYARKAEEAVVSADNRADTIDELAEILRDNLQAEFNYYDDNDRLHEYFVDCFLDNDPVTQGWTVDDDYILYTND